MIILAGLGAAARAAAVSEDFSIGAGTTPVGTVASDEAVACGDSAGRGRGCDPQPQLSAGPLAFRFGIVDWNIAMQNNKPIILTFVRYYLPGYKSGGPIRTIANGAVEHSQVAETMAKHDLFSFQLVARTMVM